MTWTKRLVGWLLVWVADVVVAIVMARWEWQMPLTMSEQMFRDLAFAAAAIGAILIPIVARRELCPHRRRRLTGAITP